MTVRNDTDKTRQMESFGRQYMLSKGLKVYKDNGRNAAIKEMKQMHDRVCFTPLSIADLKPSEKNKAMEALMLLSEKRANLE